MKNLIFQSSSGETRIKTSILLSTRPHAQRRASSSKHDWAVRPKQLLVKGARYPQKITKNLIDLHGILRPFVAIFNLFLLGEILIITKKKFRNLELIWLHLKLQKNLESKKVTEKGEYYFSKGFKYVVSCAKQKYSRLWYSNSFYIIL